MNQIQLDRIEAKIGQLDTRLALHYPTPAEATPPRLHKSEERAARKSGPNWARDLPIGRR